jgi:energy-coupling factor transporter transmembrane protein EcfT
MVLGGLFVLIGAVLLAGQFVRFDIGHYGWPFFVIAPGILILVVALTARGAISEGLAIVGSIVTVSGLILLVQDATAHYESWAYAWALVFPGAIGLGMVLYGLTARRPGNVRSGTRLVGIALVIFLLGAAFFEGIVGISGYQLDHRAGVVLGVLIIAVGAVMLVLNLTSSGRRPR